MQDKSSRAVLPQARHQSSMHLESTLWPRALSKRRWAPQITRDTLKTMAFSF